MSSSLRLANNAVGKLSAGIDDTSTSVYLTPGDGAKFPALSTGQWFPATLIKADGSFEIVRVTGRSTDTLTVVRARESTAAISFLAGDRIELRMTAAAYEEVFTRPYTTGIIEEVDIAATAATGTINFDLLDNSIGLLTANAVANWTLNVRGNSTTTLDSIMAVGQSISITYMVTQGATPFYNNVFKIDGVTITPKWQGGSAPSSGNASGIDSYSYAIIKTGAATFVVLASQTKFA